MSRNKTKKSVELKRSLDEVNLRLWTVNRRIDAALAFIDDQTPFVLGTPGTPKSQFMPDTKGEITCPPR